eukprot:6151704-Amphidinium_carterae.1
MNDMGNGFWCIQAPPEHFNGVLLWGGDTAACLEVVRALLGTKSGRPWGHLKHEEGKNPGI